MELKLIDFDGFLRGVMAKSLVAQMVGTSWCF